MSIYQISFENGSMELVPKNRTTPGDNLSLSAEEVLLDNGLSVSGLYQGYNLRKVAIRPYGDNRVLPDKAEAERIARKHFPLEQSRPAQWSPVDRENLRLLWESRDTRYAALPMR
ncbi:MAG: hypothetical protein HYW26_06075 [Candidatus Aenigmarchaeota archaeon]|nr:hypothetical protein [Candidatus Aenigmarchaeota archaeon]